MVRCYRFLNHDHGELENACSLSSYSERMLMYSSCLTKKKKKYSSFVSIVCWALVYVPKLLTLLLCEVLA